ncbi:ABC transporter substrate-binding protein [Phaeobacter sp. B1627]|uniref:ABC transporter substrate-binding protein n=1 Tax=Phaeobacter sp. B1627 TaxID=2583809 RepID=UPI00111A3677|nr:ABC transporter substrate-binding protein [Phaeobacter sp. B1627]TNJ47486.1 iron-siderophore ABC transporter substrate-binding protein [Phaeobacter sp. B1627]
MRHLFILMCLCAVSLLPNRGIAQAFPVEIEHIFGVTRIETEPTRVVSLSFIGHDFLLSLGVVPYALRKWYGAFPYGVWPWAQEALGDGTPIVMQGEIDIEAIAAMDPDLIVGQWSGMSAREYALLSEIAPTVATAPGSGDYGMTWQQMLLRLGQATGRSERAEEIVAGLEQRFAELRQNHPSWQGATGLMVWAGTIGAYTQHDIRGKFLAELGFVPTEPVLAYRGLNQSYYIVPEEDLAPIDADVLLWLDGGGSVARLNRLPLRRFMRAYLEGREIYSGLMLTSALSHSSPLSIEYALDTLVPLLEQAMDGDPATEVTSSREAGLLARGVTDGH